MSEQPTSEQVLTVTRYKHEFQRNSGSREMVEDADGQWVRLDDVQDAMAFVTGYLSEHKGLLQDLRAHQKVLDSVQYIIDEINKL